MSEGDSGYGSVPEKGARRKKIAGYLKAANELRQTYQAQYLGNPNESSAYEEDGSLPGAFPDVSVVRNGDEEMLLFPSYARRHHKRPGFPHEKPGASEDLRAHQDSGDAEFWKKQWDKYEDDTAVVDVDIRGWVYTPHKGQMTRKNRLLVGIARHLSGVPAPSSSASNSRASSPHRAKLEARTSKHEEEIAEKEAKSIEQRGQGEADIAWRGGYSEAPSSATEQSSLYGSPDQSRSTSPNGGAPEGHSLPRPVTNTSLGDALSPKPGSKRVSWNQPSEMTPAELAVANANLMLRLKPFLSTPLVQTPLTIFFYNEDQSKSRTVYTNEAGHFQLRAPLEFVPTHVRVLASDKLSATEEIRITEPKGISMISDIDDTIKHTAINSGAKEIFRNAFIRDLGDLTIEGVKEWYQQMADMDVKLHYVSNAPWQLYPILVNFFAEAGLPAGSFHLKQYTGMLQGIFEPVAERKRGTLDKILNDFPERRFILVGDSGEADLELYTDIVMANPGRVLGVFIRDVTTTQPQRFFDSSILPRKTKSPRSSPLLRGRSGGLSPKIRPLENLHLDGPPPPPLPPRVSAMRSSSSQALENDGQGPKMGTLIDVDDDPTPPPKPERPVIDERPSTSNSDSMGPTRSSPPNLPSKPQALRSISSSVAPGASNPSVNRKPAPPLPPKRGQTSPSNLSEPQSQQQSTTNPSPLSQIQTSSTLPNPTYTQRDSSNPLQASYRTMAKAKLASAYNNLPTLYNTNPANSNDSDNPSKSSSGRPPPPPPPRRPNLSSSTSASTYPPLANHSRTHSYSQTPPDGSADDPANQPLLSKKEEAWHHRWHRAREIFERKGVLLKSWRVGADVAAEAVQVVEEALKEEERNRTKE